MAGFNSILKIFLPKDRVFFQLFESVVDVLVSMGEKLKEVVNEPDFDERAKLIKEIEELLIEVLRGLSFHMKPPPNPLGAHP